MKPEHPNKLSGRYFRSNDPIGNGAYSAGFWRRSVIGQDLAQQRRLWSDEIVCRQCKVEKVF